MSEIVVCGTCRVGPDAIVAQLKTVAGQPFDPKVIEQDIRSIDELGLFDNVFVRRFAGPLQSVKLQYEVRERPSVADIRFEGSTRVKQKDLKEVITLQRYAAVQDSQLAASREAIQKLYRNKGFFLTRVTSRLVPKQFNNSGETCPVVDVLFHISESEPVRIASIDFFGNKQLKADRLHQVMLTQQNHPFGFMTGWGRYVPEALQEDLLRLQQLYQSQGYLKIQVGRPRVSLNADQSRLHINIGLQEGQQYFLGDLDIQGDFIVPSKQQAKQALDRDEVAFAKPKLLRFISLKKGDVFNRPRMVQDVQRIADRYRNEGYAYVNVEPQMNINEQTRHADLSLLVDAGPRVVIERIDIKGNDKTADQVIRREIRVYEGELYSESMLRISQRRLKQLGYFKEVRLSKKPGSARDKMILEFEVEEKNTTQAQVGGSWGTGGEGFIFNGSVGFANFLGRGQSLNANLSISKRRQTFHTSFTEPYVGLIGLYPVSLSLSGYHSYTLLQGFSRVASGGSITSGYPIGAFFAPVSHRWFQDAIGTARDYIPDWENLEFLLRYRLERVHTQQQQQYARLYDLRLHQPQYTTSITPILQLDQRNNRLEPTRGYLLQFQSEYAFGELGGMAFAKLENSLPSSTDPDAVNIPATSSRFVRNSITTRVYYDFDDWFLWKGWTLRFNLQMGILTPLNGPLLFNNYALGGTNSLRGYPHRSIGPVQQVFALSPDEPLRDFSTGGTKQLLGNLELEFPVIKLIGLRFVTFFDFGNVYGPGENFFYLGQSSLPAFRNTSFDPARDLFLGLFGSAGFGIRWKTPFGLLRFEFGFPVPRRPVGTPGKRDGDGAMHFGFGIGAPF
ncbi:MAG: outer membrane protein assembly factor BamA [Myxococcota bacterium]